MKLDERKCPRCAEAIKLDATVCRHCGAEFDAATVKAAQKKAAREKLAGCGGCAGLVVLMATALGMCTASETVVQTDPVETPQQKAEREQAFAVRRGLGLHCTIGGNGQQIRDFEREVTRRLRDPNSFQPVTTRIMPAVDGVHPVEMTYRAANGYGGLNVAVARGRLTNRNCLFQFDSLGE